MRDNTPDLYSDNQRDDKLQWGEHPYLDGQDKLQNLP